MDSVCHVSSFLNELKSLWGSRTFSKAIDRIQPIFDSRTGESDVKLLSSRYAWDHMLENGLIHAGQTYRPPISYASIPPLVPAQMLRLLKSIALGPIHWISLAQFSQ
jgi:hypothetical protein